jgi:hypothetical protein
MPWIQTTPMDQKTQFIADYLREIFSFSELCTRLRGRNLSGMSPHCFVNYLPDRSAGHQPWRAADRARHCATNKKNRGLSPAPDRDYL